MKRIRQRTVELVLGSLVEYYGLRKVNVRGKAGAHKGMVSLQKAMHKSELCNSLNDWNKALVSAA